MCLLPTLLPSPQGTATYFILVQSTFKFTFFKQLLLVTNPHSKVYFKTAVSNLFIDRAKVLVQKKWQAISNLKKGRQVKKLKSHWL
jgi:hypothetical protein